MTKEEFSSTARIQTNLTVLPELMLQGNLDRLDFAINGSVSRVVDYKTGKTKSRKDIMGETATSDGNYRRQLSFYALLLSLHEDNRYHCPYGVLSFIEPHTNGKIVEELFESDSENQAGVKAEILETLEMLLRGDFWFDEILAADSEYASLATLLQDRLRT
jgi:ATP-dependent helicase/DNAse subunit B